MNKFINSISGLIGITKYFKKTCTLSKYKDIYTFNRQIQSTNDISKIRIIASISKTIVDIKNKTGEKFKKTQYIASTVLHGEELNFKLLLDNMRSANIAVPIIHIIKISLNMPYSSEEKTTKLEEPFIFSNEEEQSNAVLMVTELNIYHFFKKLESYFMVGTKEYEKLNFNYDSQYPDYIAPSPIFIFEGVSWSNIVLMFKLNGLEISGGTISRRHKLNINEYKLALFLVFTNIFTSKNKLYESYKDSGITNQNLDELIYNNSYDMNIGVTHSSLVLNNPVISLYYRNNILFNLTIKKEKLISEISNLEKEIQENEESFLYFNNEISFLEKEILKFKNRNVENARMKHKLVLGGRIKNLKKELESLRSRKSNLLINLDNNKLKINQFKSQLKDITSKFKQFDLNDLECNLENTQALRGRNNPQEDLSNGSKLVKDSELKSNTGEFKSKSSFQSTFSNQKRGYISVAKSTLKNLKRSYSSLSLEEKVSREKKLNTIYSDNKNIMNNSKNYNIDSFIYQELIRILIENEHNDDTQLKIENFLISQSKVIIDVSLNKNKDLNYVKFSTYPNFIKILLEKVSIIESLLNKERETILQENESRGPRHKKDYFKWIFLLKHSSNELIINKLLGRMLRIFSNDKLLNHNTVYTDNAIELASDLINDYLYNLYKSSSKKRKWEMDKVITTVKRKNQISSLNIEDPVQYSYSMWKSENNELIEKYSDNVLLFNIGTYLFKILIDIELLDINLIKSAVNKSTQVLVLGSEFKNINIKNYLVDLSYKVPMIVKPKIWRREKINGGVIERLGGFMNNDEKFTNSLIIYNWELKEKSSILDQNIIYDMVNNLQSVPFKLNTEVLDFVINKGIDYGMLIDPDYIHPLENQAEGRKLTMNQQKTLDSHLSKKKLESNILGLASVFRNVKEIFIPVRLDNRGRVYCNVDYLNYQGTELAKALLSFARGNIIYKTDTKAIDYFKIYGANCFGNKLDKESFDERINWVNKNEEEIINLNLLKKAENKILFLAFCLEYRKYYECLLNSKKYFVSHLPIQLDATCNGFQHLALLTGDENLAKHLNLTPSDWQDKPEDFYSFLAFCLKEYFKNQLDVLNTKVMYANNLHNICKSTNSSNNGQEKSSENKKNALIPFSLDIKDLIDSFQRLSRMDIHRKVIKKPAMTKIYNVSHFSMAQYIKEEFDYIEDELNKENWYVYKGDSNIKLKGKDIYLLTKSIDVILYSKFPKYDDLNKYLKKIANICVQLQIPILWVLPTGLQVIQSYVTSKEIKLKPFKYRSNTFILREATDNLNRRKQVRALMPNLVHSLDAASLGLLTEMFFDSLAQAQDLISYNNRNEDDNRLNFKNFYAIHDCFATTANNLDSLSNFIKTVYFQIYSNEIYLLNFDKRIKESIKLQWGNQVFITNSSGQTFIKINELKIDIEYPNILDVVSQDIMNNKFIYENMLKSSYTIS